MSTGDDGGTARRPGRVVAFVPEGLSRRMARARKPKLDPVTGQYASEPGVEANRELVSRMGGWEGEGPDDIPSGTK